NMVKRALDMVAHFGEGDFAILLPNTAGASAAFVANRAYQALTSTALDLGVDTRTLALAFGVAALQRDCGQLDQLLLAAKLAMNQARDKKYPIVLSRPNRN